MESVINGLVEFIQDNSVVILLSICSVYFTVIYGYVPFNFWKNLGVPQVNVRYPFVGNFLESVKVPIHEVSVSVYKAFPNERFIGTYNVQQPVLILRDPDLIEAVLVKDFPSMPNRGNNLDLNGGKFQKHLVNLKDDQWKNTRNKLTPAFTPGKIKGMYAQVVEITESFMMNVLKDFEDGRHFEVSDEVNRLTMDIIFSCGFGLDIDTINHPDSELREMGLAAFQLTSWTKIMFALRALPRPIREFIWKFTPNSGRYDEFFTNVVDSSIKHKKMNNIMRQDFLYLMNEIKEKEEELIKMKQIDPNDPNTFDHTTLLSNAWGFFVVGFDSTSRTISFCLYELSINQDVQEKLYKEVSTVQKKHGGFPTYEALHEMVYLDQVIHETLRIHPALPGVSRKVSKEYRLPGTDVIIPAGANVFLPIYALHHDPLHFPDPETFRPERFDKGEKCMRKGTYLPFGDGPRSCIGARFAKMSLKLAISTIVGKYKISSCKKTEVPMKYDPKSFLLAPKGGIWVTIQPRS